MHPIHNMNNRIIKQSQAESTRDKQLTTMKVNTTDTEIRTVYG